MSPLSRVLAMVDSANGISAELDPRGVSLRPGQPDGVARARAGRGVGRHERGDVIASEGVGTTHARLFDTRGYFGETLADALRRAARLDAVAS